LKGIPSASSLSYTYFVPIDLETYSTRNDSTSLLFEPLLRTLGFNETTDCNNFAFSFSPDFDEFGKLSAVVAQ